MSNMTQTPEHKMHIQGHETATHTRMYWHAHITVYIPTGNPDGSSWCHNFRCTHDHESRDNAQQCENTMIRLAKRHGADLTAHAAWVTAL